MNGKLIMVGMLNPDSQYESNNRVYSFRGISPSIRARDYKDPPKILIEVSGDEERGNADREYIRI